MAGADMPDAHPGSAGVPPATILAGGTPALPGCKKIFPRRRCARSLAPMAFKHWPLVRDVRFAQKCGRYLRGARKRRPDLPWDEFLRVARHFKQDDMGSYPERGFLFQLAADAPANAQVVEVGSWMGASTCFIAAGLKGERAKIFAVDNFQGLSTCGEDAAWY